MSVLRVAALFAAFAFLTPVGVSAHTEQIEYYALDAIGSVRVVFDASGAVIGRMDYAPFGEELSRDPVRGTWEFDDQFEISRGVRYAAMGCR